MRLDLTTATGVATLMLALVLAGFAFAVWVSQPTAEPTAREVPTVYDSAWNGTRTAGGTLIVEGALP